MGYPRQLLVPPDTDGVYHCVSRCVRRAFLCGADALTGQCFDHRRDWIEQRLVELAEIFSVSLLGYAVMSNHVHVVVHVQCEEARRWPDVEVARRWVRLFPPRDDDADGVALKQACLMADPARLATCRERLASLSWFMRCLSEPIARRANQEDGCSGRFWEGRFKCQALLDDRAVLAAMTYVDLNPVRAGLTQSLQDSAHTSVGRRLQEALISPTKLSMAMQPVAGPASSALSRLSLAAYVDLVDWTGRQIRPDKRGHIAAQTPHALTQIAHSDERWLLEVRAIGSGYWRAVGCAHALLERAAAMGQRWLKGVGLARALESV